jgi:hypothetical protein
MPLGFGGGAGAGAGARALRQRPPQIKGPWCEIFQGLPIGSCYALTEVVTRYMRALVFLKAFQENDAENVAKMIRNGVSDDPSDSQKTDAWKILLRLVPAEATSSDVEFEARNEAWCVFEKRVADEVQLMEQQVQEICNHLHSDDTAPPAAPNQFKRKATALDADNDTRGVHPSKVLKTGDIMASFIAQPANDGVYYQYCANALRFARAGSLSYAQGRADPHCLRAIV